MSCIQTYIYEMQGDSIQFLLLQSFIPAHKGQPHVVHNSLSGKQHSEMRKVLGERTNLFRGPTPIYSRTLQHQRSRVCSWMGMLDLIQT